MPSVAQMEPAKLGEADQGESHLSVLLHPSHPLRYYSSDVC